MFQQLLARRGTTGGLGESGTVERQGLVGSDDEATGIFLGYFPGLFARKQPRNLTRIVKTGGSFNSPFIDIGRAYLDREPRSLEKRAPDRAPGSQYEW